MSLATLEMSENFTTLTLDSRTSLNPVMSLTGHPSVSVPNGFAPLISPDAPYRPAR